MTYAKVHSIESAGALDGPGLRYVLFLKGCPFRCKFCHNPDTWTASDAKGMSASEVLQDAKKYEDFFKFSNGGVTISGGEPLMQAEFTAELLGLLKSENIHSAIDTCGGVALDDNVKKAALLADLIMLDIKHVDEFEHINLTKKSRENTLRFLEFIETHSKRYWIRAVMISNYTATEKYAEKLADFLSVNAPHAELVELLPHHNLGLFKWKNLGLKNEFENLVPPTKCELEKVSAILASRGFKTKL